MNLGESSLKDFVLFLFLFFGVLMFCVCWAMCEDLHIVGADDCWVAVCCTGAVFSSSSSGISSSLLSVAGGGNGNAHCFSLLALVVILLTGGVGSWVGICVIVG